MKYNAIKSPPQCQNMNEICKEIDHIDYTIIHLLSTRFEYVKVASKFKKNAIDVEAKERFMSILEQRKEWGDKLGLNGEVIKKLYSDLVKYFISEELKYFDHQ